MEAKRGPILLTWKDTYLSIMWKLGDEDEPCRRRIQTRFCFDGVCFVDVYRNGAMRRTAPVVVIYG
jgi:hypothetical protein